MKTIAIQAFTNSEWDNVNFAIIQLTDLLVNNLKHYTSIAEKVASGTPNTISLAYVSFYDASAKFRSDNNEETEINFDSPVITLETEDIGTPPENALDTFIVKAYTGGGIQFICYGKHTSEEFWTDTVMLSDILKIYENV
jgi:hypothetical protein